MQNPQILELADKLKELTEKKKMLDAEVKAVTAEIEAVDKELSDAMTEAEMQNFSRKGSIFYLKSRLFASPVAGKKDEMMQALKANGYGSIVTENVNANTSASFIKERREITGTDIPPWLDGKVSAFEKVSVGIRKA